MAQCLENLTVHSEFFPMETNHWKNSGTCQIGPTPEISNIPSNSWGVCRADQPRVCINLLGGKPKDGIQKKLNVISRFC